MSEVDSMGVGADPTNGYSSAAKISFWVVTVLLLTMAFTLAFHEVRDLDIGFHLKAGDWILQNMKFPDKDVFTYTINDRDYIDLYWFYQVCLSISYKIAGSLGLVLLHASLVVLNFGMIARRVRQLGAVRVISYSVVMFVAIMAASYHFTIRPHIFSWTFMNLTFLTLESYYRDRSTKLWPLPVIMLFWANSHTLFVLGWVLFACYFVGISVEERKFDTKLFKYAAMGVGVCFINPYFIRGVWLPVQQALLLQEGSLYKELISEYRSPFAGGLFRSYFVLDSFVIFQSTFFFHLLLVMMGVAAAIKFFVARDRKLHEFLLLLLFTAIMVSAFKNIGYFIMAVTPFTINGLGYLFAPPERRNRNTKGLSTQRFARRKERERPVLRPSPTGAFFWTNVVVGVIAIVTTMRVITDAYYTAWRSRDVTGYEMSTNNMPIAAASFMRVNGLTGKLLNHINFGGIYEYMLPQPAFIDARNEIVGEKFFAEYRQMNNPKKRPLILNKYQPQIVSFPPRVEEGWHDYFRESPDWRLVYADDIAAVYLHKGYAEQVPTLDSVSVLRQRNIPIRKMSEIDSIIRTKKESGLIDGLFSKQYYPNSEIDFCSFLLNNKWYTSAVYAGVEGLARSTVDAPGMYYNLGQAFVHLGDYRHALYCYKRYLPYVSRPDPKLVRLMGKLQTIIEKQDQRQSGGAK